MATFETDAIAEYMRIAAIYWDKRGIESRARVLRRWAEEVNPPAIKCTAHGCDHDALFRVELPASGDTPGVISFRCGDHVAVWLSCNAPFGTVAVDLL